MSYTPTEWKTGDVITAPKLNNIEQGILNAGSGGSGGGIFLAVISQTDGTYSCDKTVAEMNQAFTDGKLCLFVERVPYVGGYNIYTTTRVTPSEIEAQRTFFNVMSDTEARVMNTSVLYREGTGSGGTDEMTVKTDTVYITITK